MFGKTMKIFVILTALMFITAASVWAGGGSSLKGKEFIYGNWWADWTVDSFTPSNDSQQRWVDWRKKIQADNGFKMQEKMVGDWNSMLETLTTTIMAGRPAAHIAVVSPSWAIALHRQKLLAPLSDSKAVNFKTTERIPGKQNAWSQEVMSAFTFSGKFYAIAPSGGISSHETGIYYNRRLFREAGLSPDTPYDMQKAGTWTWANYLDLCKKLTRDTNNDGRVDTYAMPSDFIDQMLEVFAFSNGAMWIAKDNQGKFVNATGRPEFIEAMQFILTLRDSNVCMPRPEGSNWDWVMPQFQEGRVAMVVFPIYVRNDLRGMTDDWGWVLPPKGPKAKDYLFPDDENVTIVPSTYKPEEVDGILTAFNLWVMPAPDPQGLDGDWRTNMYQEYRDPRAVDETNVMIRSGKHNSFRYNLLIPGLQVGDIAWQLWWLDGEPAQLSESVSANWNALVADANNIK